MQGQILSGYATILGAGSQSEIEAVWLVAREAKFSDMNMSELRAEAQSYPIRPARSKDALVAQLMQCERNALAVRNAG